MNTFTKVEVTKIKLMKVSDFCQLACPKSGSFSDLRFPSTIGLAYGFLSHDWRGGGGSYCTFLALFIFKCMLSVFF
jgi:hypothetical protein